MPRPKEPPAELSEEALNTVTGAVGGYNLQYVLLQTKMQMENREASLISNIMTTKHETTAKSLQNIK